MGKTKSSSKAKTAKNEDGARKGRSSKGKDSRPKAGSKRPKAGGGRGDKTTKSSQSPPPSGPAGYFRRERDDHTLPLFLVRAEDYTGFLESSPPAIQAWLKARDFRPKAGAFCVLPADTGLAGAVVVTANKPCLWDFSSLPKGLPPGSYEIEPDVDQPTADAVALGWALGAYRFDRYKRHPHSPKCFLVWPEAANKTRVTALAEGMYLGRDLVSTPASDLGPAELAAAAVDLAQAHKAKCQVIVGESLLAENYPMIHAVGRASDRAPRLVDIRWGKSKHPKLTLVGKGVCFDSGGLDLKPAQYMKLMKKDMGGAACVLGLAHVIMALELPVRLRVLIPAVENSVSGNAMRPLDVLNTRKGVTVEVGDTDAEGRLILADALWEAASEQPDLLLDAATLTGAARVALGTAMPAIFCNRTETWQALEASAEQSFDPLWRLPLHEPYRKQLDSRVADLSSTGSEGTGGAITAALFLREFAGKDVDWVHMDTMGYNLTAQPGRPSGGEALGLRALFDMLETRYLQ